MRIPSGTPERYILYTHNIYSVRGASINSRAIRFGFSHVVHLI